MSMAREKSCFIIDTLFCLIVKITRTNFRNVLDQFRTMVIWAFSLAFGWQEFHYLQVCSNCFYLISLNHIKCQFKLRHILTVIMQTYLNTCVSFLAPLSSTTPESSFRMNNIRYHLKLRLLRHYS